LENDDLVVTLSNVGGSAVAITLKNYSDETGKPITFISEDDGVKSFGVMFSKGKVDCDELLFSLYDKSSRTVVFTALEGDLEIRKTFSLEEAGFLLRAKVEIANKSAEKTFNAEYEFSADENIAFTTSYDKRFVLFAALDGEKVRTTHFDKIESKGVLYEGANEWMALRRKYFSIFVKPSFTMQHARAQIVRTNVLRGIIKAPERELVPGERLSDEFAIFIGPTKLDLLKSFDMGFEKTFSGGFWGLFRMWLLVLLGFFYNVFRNYGVAIIALTITIKILFIPLTHKSFSSMKKMQELQPKMKALQEQFKSEPQKLNKEVMGLYKKHKVNPLGGCFPLLLQMPIFIALYQVLSEAVELRGAPFCLWIKDLAEADKLVSFSFTIPLVNISSLNILPILMMFSMVWQQKLTGSTGQTKEQQNMMLMMPVVFVFIFYNLPSGLVLYWLLNNILTIAHQLLSHRLHPATTETA
jgi:YidC/Oxa1 family membrane protein insertase